MSIVDRLLGSRRITPSGCWEWTKSLKPNGYGAMAYDGRHIYPHRAAWEAFRGPIPDGLVIDHLCRNRACFNPDHLEPVTQAENLRRGRSAEATRQRHAAVTHCPQGRPYDEANTHIKPSGARRCRACAREYARRTYQKRTAA